MGRVSVGARRLPLADFVAVCISGDQVLVDAALLSKIDADLAAAKPQPDSAPVQVAAVKNGCASLTELHSRAVVLQLLLRLAQGKYRIRSAIVTSLADLLNDRTQRLTLPEEAASNAIATLLGHVTRGEYDAIQSGVSLPLGTGISMIRVFIH